jgi:hypothetical protein
VRRLVQSIDQPRSLFLVPIILCSFFLQLPYHATINTLWPGHSSIIYQLFELGGSRTDILGSKFAGHTAWRVGNCIRTKARHQTYPCLRLNASARDRALRQSGCLDLNAITGTRLFGTSVTRISPILISTRQPAFAAPFAMASAWCCVIGEDDLSP